MIIRKITTGYVIQEFNEAGLFLKQEFVAGDDVAFENDVGASVEEDDYEVNFYFPFDMVQNP